jgi:uncharacterized protein
VQTSIDHLRSFLCFSLIASAQTPTPETTVAARGLVATLKIGEQYKMLLPPILLRIKPAVTQAKAELENNYDIIATQAGGLDLPAAAMYAANFSVDEMRQMEAFFPQPAIARPCSPKDLIDISCASAHLIQNVDAIADQPPVFCEIPKRIDRGMTLLRRQREDR